MSASSTDDEVRAADCRMKEFVDGPSTQNAELEAQLLALNSILRTYNTYSY